ncbi:hypothetical protein M5K25_017032 [Dendrobium thyrsiflorum]|uniref:GRF-type domain-containing protein n=1 Tax=Dendrobium thyrsiflorum TaxID=117978 RepID=A0ABD0UM22_DENTH
MSLGPSNSDIIKALKFSINCPQSRESTLAVHSKHPSLLFDCISDMSSSRSNQSPRSQDNPIYCRCNLQGKIYTFYKTNNRGRKFYRCPRSRSEDDCRYFQSLDEENDDAEDMNRLRSANASEVNSKHSISITFELLQIELLLVILIVLVAIGVNSSSKACQK